MRADAAAEWKQRKLCIGQQEAMKQAAKAFSTSTVPRTSETKDKATNTDEEWYVPHTAE